MRWEKRVRGDRDRADLDRPEERVDECRRIEAQDQNALLESDPELAERVAAAIDVPCKLAVRDGLPLAADRDDRLADTAMRIDECLGGVVPRGQLREPRRRCHAADCSSGICPTALATPGYPIRQRCNGSSTTAFQKMGYNSLILNRFTLRDQFFSSDYSDSLVGDGVRKGDVGLLKQELA